jgi:predicted DNA-binding transcriptional regulator YafY
MVLFQRWGIFSGAEVRCATLRFTPERARWVANERWHGQQVGSLLKDGGYELKVPYTKDPELLMDILKFGADYQVLAPKLRDRVAAEVCWMASELG